MTTEPASGQWLAPAKPGVSSIRDVGPNYASSMDEQVGLPEQDAEPTVRALLRAARLQPPEAEIERLVKLYPGLRQSVDRFHGVNVGDEVTAALFRAADQEPQP